MFRCFTLLLLFPSFFHHPSYSQSSCLENEAVRLVGGALEREGKVEICLSQQWGTICDELWSNEDAQVVCRQLSLPTRGAVAIPGSPFSGDSSARIWLNNVQCTGIEAKLLQCSSNQLGLDNCRHASDAGVRCPSDSVCEFGEVRLSGGSSLSGRVEVCVDNSWNTVCSTSWSNADTTVLCRQLGHSINGARVLSPVQTPDGTGAIWSAIVQCSGTETGLVLCPIRQQDVTMDCNHDADIGVSCQPSIPVCSEGNVRLFGGSDSLSGRVEICRQNEWGTVCATERLWGVESATVVCRQLDYSTEASQSINPGSGIGNDGVIWLEDVQCSGSERNLSACLFTNLISLNCTHDRDVGVRCQPRQDCIEGSLRLAGGRTLNEGRVEMCYANEWGTVCDDSWASPDATVVCEQLDLPSSAAIAVSRAGFGSASETVRIFLDNIHCVGSEQRLLNCQHSPLGVHNCGHREDAGVICQGSLSTSAYPKGTVRLVGGNSSLEGRVEIFQNNQWGTVCGLLWDEADARVVCRQLGFSSVGALPLGAVEFGGGVGQIWLSSVRCSGVENRLVDCASSQGTEDYRCYHNEDAAVRCQDENVIGPPTSASVTFSAVNCSHVTIIWEPPLNPGSIIGYDITLTSAGQLAGQYFSRTESLELMSLTCCSDYSYAVSARASEPDVSTVASSATFRTRPDLTDPVVTAASAINDTLISVQWTVPSSVARQGVTAYFVTVASECFTNEQKGQPQNFSVSPNGSLQITAGHLEPFVPYRVTLNSTICRTSIQVYNQILYTQRNVVRPPVITDVQRDLPTSTSVHFTVPSSERNADYFEVSYYNSTGSNFQQEFLVQTIQTTNQLIIFHGLEPCLRYWVRVAAINCGSHIISSPKLVDLAETADFMFVIVLEEGEECGRWIVEDQTLVGVRGEVTLQLEQCELQVPCTADTVLSCSRNHTNAEYRTTLVTFNSSSRAAEQSMCLRDWVTEVGTIQIRGRTLSTVLSIQPPVTESKENLVYVWVLLGIILTGMVLATVLVLLALVLKRAKKQEIESTDGPVMDDTPMKVTENRLYRSSSNGGQTDSGRGNSDVEISQESAASSTSVSSKKSQMTKSYPLVFNAPDY